ERIALEVAGRGDRVLVLAEQVLHALQAFRIRCERGIRRGEELELVAKALRLDAQAMQALRGRVLDDLASEPSEPLDALAEPPRGELGERREGRFPFVALDGRLERGERRPKLLEARPDEHVRRRRARFGPSPLQLERVTAEIVRGDARRRCDVARQQLDVDVEIAKRSELARERAQRGLGVVGKRGRQQRVERSEPDAEPPRGDSQAMDGLGVGRFAGGRRVRGERVELATEPIACEAQERMLVRGAASPRRAERRTGFLPRGADVLRFVHGVSFRRTAPAAFHFLTLWSAFWGVKPTLAGLFEHPCSVYTYAAVKTGHFRGRPGVC